MPLHYRLRGKVWHVRGTVGIGAEVRNVDERSTRCRDEALAREYGQRLEHEIQRDILEGDRGRAKRHTVAQALHLYLTRPEPFGQLDIWRIGELGRIAGDFKIADAKAGWQKFVAERCKDRPIGKTLRRDLAPATVERFRSIYQAALHYACAHWEIAAPKVAVIDTERPPPIWLPLKTQNRLLAAYSAPADAVAEFLCFEGCRTQEALRADWRHVNWSNGTVFFPETKNGKARTVTLHPRVRTRLRKMWVERKRPDQGAIFLSSRGEPYEDTRGKGGNPLKKPHATACRRAGVSGFTVHDWRSHFASWFVMNGGDLDGLMKHCGWTDERSAIGYLSVATHHTAKIVRKMK